MSTPLISVVIPVYNVADYLPSCIDSVLQQTYRNLEIILVDDGSTDECGSICDSYGRKSSQIRVIHQKNKGLSAARNAGVKEASGELVAFIDSDDIVSCVFIEALNSAKANSGCNMATVRCGTKFYNERFPCLEQDFSTASSYRILTEVEYQRELLYQKSGNGAPWRLCAREMLLRHAFPEGLVYEDLATTYKIVRECGSIAVLDAIDLYGYRQRHTSIMRGEFAPEIVSSCIGITQTLYRDISTWYPTLNTAAASRCFSVCRVTYARIPVSEDEARASIWNEILYYRRIVLHDKDARKKERLAALFSTLGQLPFSVFCTLYKKVLH